MGCLIRKDDCDASDISVYHYNVKNYGNGSPTASTAVRASSLRRATIDSPRRPRSPTFLSEKYAKERLLSAGRRNSPRPSAPKQLKSSSSLNKSGSRGSMNRKSSGNLRRSNSNNSRSSVKNSEVVTANQEDEYDYEDSMDNSYPGTPSATTTCSRPTTPNAASTRGMNQQSKRKYKREEGMIVAPDE